MNSSKGPSEALTFSSADLRIDHELNFIRRDGGPALFKSGDNVTCVLTSYPQRGPVRKDGNPTLSVIYSRSRVPTNRKTRRSDPTIAAGCALRTVQQMLIPRSMVKTRIRCKVINVQHGPNEAESAVNATSLSLLQSNYDLRTIIAAISYTKSQLGQHVFFPTTDEIRECKMSERPRYEFHFDVNSNLIWFSVRGPSDLGEFDDAVMVCREASKTVFAEMHLCAARGVGSG